MNVAYGIITGAATGMVLTAGGTLEWAASPCEAIVGELIDTAAGAAFRTRIVIVANSGRLYWRWTR
ncbi:hypothetical protein, partial [Acinetobacter indicus]|uniref:hypothetical protein n=1 Tax=Acinetobacter indicus TaxID=756892 RepID=UPI001C091179